MPVVVIANPKGGVGKSTLATHVAGYWARKGHAVVLGDVDRQQSARLWLGLRPPQARPIALWDTGDGDAIAKPPKGSHAVLDTPAGLHGWRLSDALKLADKIIVPLQASIFDIYATRDFLDQLASHRRAGHAQVGIVGMRVDERTRAAEQLHHFVDGLGLPVLGICYGLQWIAQHLDGLQNVPRAIHAIKQQAGLAVERVRIAGRRGLAH